MKQIHSNLKSKITGSHLFRIPFSTFTTKTFNSTVIFENNKILAKIDDASIEIKQPLGMLLGVLGACELHTMEFHSKKNKIDIEKISINIKGEYDMDIFLGKKQEKNTYSSIDIEVSVQSKENDRKKLAEAIEKAMNMCPVANTLRLAGIKMNEKIEYI